MLWNKWTTLVLLSLLWGGSYIFVEIALVGFTPLTLVLLRVGLAAATLWAVVWLRGHRVPGSPGVWLAYGVMGLLSNVLPFSLISWGQLHITAGQASILNATVPIFTVLMVHAMARDERMGLRQWAGVAVGFFGVVVLMLPTLHAGVSWLSLGQFAALGASVCYAAGVVFGKRFRETSPTVNAAAMLSCSTVLLLPAVLIAEQPWRLRPDGLSWLAVVMLAELSSAAAYLVYFAVLRRWGATHLSLVTYLIPVTALTLGVMLLREALEPVSLVGVGVIFVGLAVIDGRLLTVVRPARVIVRG